MPSFGDPRGLGQRAMESALVASIYESRLAAAGFGAAEVLHEHGMWMIGVATRL